MEVNLKIFQDKFVFNKSQFPGFFAGWGTGKSMSLIFRGMVYSEEIPDNLGVIFRKEYEDLRDSTVKDFERYTHLKVNSQRDVILPNKSTIMFRHVEELNNLQNINLGWFAIEQIEELETDNEFFLLWGRLRRQGIPSDYFKKLGLAERSGFVVGNSGRRWNKRLWKDKDHKYSHIFDISEATTYDNKENLPKDFLERLDILKVEKPEIYNRYVMNSWDVDEEGFILIPYQTLEDLYGVNIFYPIKKRLITCDPSMGGDECVIYAIENYRVMDKKYLHIKDTMKIAGEMMLLGNKWETRNMAVDIIGIGQGIGDRLAELKQNVVFINSAKREDVPERFYNLRAQMWWNVFEKAFRRELPYVEDEETKRQLSSTKYKVVNSKGQIQIERKDITKKRLDRSPDRADAYIYGIYAMDLVDPDDRHPIAWRDREDKKDYYKKEEKEDVIIGTDAIGGY